MTIVTGEFEKWKQMFIGMKGCSMTEPIENDERSMVTSAIPVPWAKSLKGQYNESEYKIGYLFPQKKGIKLVIDFLPAIVSMEDAKYVMSCCPNISELPEGTRAPTVGSYWRYTNGSDFNSFTLVIRGRDLDLISIQEEKLRGFFQVIVDGVYSYDGVYS